MIEPIKLNSNQNSYTDNKLRAFIDLKHEPPRPEPILSSGTYTYGNNQYPAMFMSVGGISVISAPSKSKKTFLKSAFIASYIGGDAGEYFKGIKGHRTAGAGILDIDTEQEKYYAHRAFKRVERMVGASYENYYPFYLRWMSASNRVQFIDDLLQDEKYQNVKLLMIDGIADLMYDANDLVESNETIEKLMWWADTYDVHICVVIHNTYGSDKPTGHLGSALLKKAESVLNLNPLGDNGDIVEVKQSYSRGWGIDKFYFTIENGLPKQCTEFGDPMGTIYDFDNNKVDEDEAPF